MTTKCYVIGMKYPTEIMETLKKSELDPIWVEGVDAKKMSDEDIKKEVTSFYSGFGPKSTIGCALAHIKTWEKIAKGDEPYSIVFEDDVVLEPNFLKSYKNAISVAGKLKFNQEIQLISNLDVMLSMDSGNGHIAAILGVKTITLWGATHPYLGFSPFNQPEENSCVSDRNLYPKLPTSIYGNKKVEGYEDAMRTILPESVVEKVVQ